MKTRGAASSPPDSPLLLRARRPLQLLAPPFVHPASLVSLFSQIMRRRSPWFQIGRRAPSWEEQGRVRPGAPPAACSLLVPDRAEVAAMGGAGEGEAWSSTGTSPDLLPGSRSGAGARPPARPTSPSHAGSPPLPFVPSLSSLTLGVDRVAVMSELQAEMAELGLERSRDDGSKGWSAHRMEVLRLEVEAEQQRPPMPRSSSNHALTLASQTMYYENWRSQDLCKFWETWPVLSAVERSNE